MKRVETELNEIIKTAEDNLKEVERELQEVENIENLDEELEGDNVSFEGF